MQNKQNMPKDMQNKKTKLMESLFKAQKDKPKHTAR
jgi:hypothetical protein